MQTRPGVFDADGNFDADGAFVIFTGNGTLKLGGAVAPNLGTLNDGTGGVTMSRGTVEYDNQTAGQTIFDNSTMGYFNLEIDNDFQTATTLADLNIHGGLTVTSGKFNIASTTTVVTGNTDIGDTLIIGINGVFDANNTFGATGGYIDFTGAGFLKCSAVVTDLGIMDDDEGTVVYDGGAQNVFADSYYNLEIDQAGTKTAQGAITVNGTMTVQNNGLVVYDIAGTTTIVTGVTTVNHTDISNSGKIKITSGKFTANGPTDINGTLEITTTGEYDANGTFTAENGTIDFDAAGFLRCSDIVTNLGTLSTDNGTVEYDGVDQDICVVNYCKLKINNTGTATYQDVTNPLVVFDSLIVEGNLTLNDAQPLDLGGNFLLTSGTFDPGSNIGHTVAGNWTENGGVFQPTTGRFTFDGNNTIITTQANAAGSGNFFNDLYINPLPGNTVSAGSFLDINGNLYVVSETMDMLTYGANVRFTTDISGTLLSGTGEFTSPTTSSITNVNLGGFLKINTGTYNAYILNSAGTIEFLNVGGILNILGDNPSITGTFIRGTGKVVYLRNFGSQFVLGLNYHDLEIDENGGVKNANGDITVHNDLTISASGPTFNMKTHDLTVTGNFLMSNGIFSGDEGTGNSHTITGNFTLEAGNFNAESSSYDVDGNLTLSGGTYTASSSTLDLAGNWDDSGGSFTGGTGTVTMSASNSAIKAGKDNKFNNLIVSGTDTINSDFAVEIGGDLTVSGTLTVVPGDTLSFTGTGSTHTIDGNLTVNTSSAVNSILDFTGSTNNTVVVDNGGILTLDGTDATGRAYLIGDAVSEIDLTFPDDISGSNNGKFVGDHFTISYPVTAGIKINSDAAHEIEYGVFKNPKSFGVLLNFESAGNLPQTIDSCSFIGVAGNDTNVRANASTFYNGTDPVTFINYGGSLAPNATDAELYDEDPSDQVTWFSNIWYSHQFFNDLNDVTHWFSMKNDFLNSFNPSDFTDANAEWIIDDVGGGSKYSASADWSPAGNVTIAGSGAELDPYEYEINVAGNTVIESGGKLNFSDIDGIFDADGDFQAADGAFITFTTEGILQIAGSAPRLGSISGAEFTNSKGTVEYDLLGGPQTIYDIPYNNLTINGNDDTDIKRASGTTLGVNGDLTITNGKLDMTVFNITTNPTGISTDQTYAGLTTVSAPGSGAILSAVVVGGTVTSILVTNPGSGYSVGDALTVSQAQLTGASSDLVITLTAANLDLVGNFSMAAGAFDAGTSTTHRVGGSWTESGGTFIPGSDGKFTFESAAGNTTITTNASFYDLSVENNTGNTISAAAALTVDNDFTMEASNTVIFSAAAALNVTGAFTMDALNTGNFITGSNTVTVTGATNIGADTLMISTGGVFDANGDFDATGAFVTFMAAPDTLKLGGGTEPKLGTLNDGLGGNITRGTVVYDNQAAGQRIYNADSAGTGYFDLVIDNNGQTATYKADPNDPLLVLGDLTITTGNLTLLNDHYLTLTGDFKMDAGSFVPGSNVSHIVSGNWTETGGTTFEATAGKFTFNGAPSTITTDAAGGNKFFNLTSAGNPVTAGYNLDIDGDFTITGGPFVPGNFNHTVAGNWDDSGGIFNAGAGTGKITFDGGTSTNIKSGLTNDFHHFEINTTADKTVITNNLDIDGDFTIIRGTFNPGAFSHDIAGNWDDSGGSFTGGTGTVTMSASNSAIKAGKDNKFNNLIVSGTDTINSDFAVEIGGDLTVSGTLTVVPGDTLSFTGTGSTHTIDGNLTVNTSSAVNSILDFHRIYK